MAEHVDPAVRLAEVFEVLGSVYRRASRRVEADVGIDGVSVGVRAVLDLLRRHGPATVPQLARVLATSRQYVQRTVNEAAGHGWVRSRANPAHQRSLLVELTDAGEAVIGTVVAREHRSLRELGRDLRAEDVDGCLRVLRGLLDHLDDLEGDGT